MSIFNTPKKNFNEPSDDSRRRKLGWPFRIILLAVLIFVFFTAKSIPLARVIIEPVKITVSPGDINKNAVIVFPESGYILPFEFGMIGPELIGSGVISPWLFEEALSRSGSIMTSDQFAILDGSYEGNLRINFDNAHFLLNLLWALGLANDNPILSQGDIYELSDGNIERFASTGGYKLTELPISEVFSNSTILKLSENQQRRVEKVASMIFRPCCDNPVIFPDCNHGMAMLGALELMASQDLSEDAMLDTAKKIHTFWFPQQTLEQAIYFNIVESKDFDTVEPERVLGPLFSSSNGYNELKKYLNQNQLIPKQIIPENDCGV